MFAASQYSAPAQQAQATPTRNPVMEITDTAWGRDVAEAKQHSPDKWYAACNKVEQWRVLWNMGYAHDIPSAFHPKFAAASRASFDVANHHYALVILSLMKVLPTAQAISEA